MPYIFKENKNYYIMKDFGDDILDLVLRKEDYFEVDELLAYPIALLCNKGYLTEMCCAGHAYGSPYFCRVEYDETFENGKNAILYEDTPEYEAFYACYEGGPDLNTFIKFQKEMSFECIPAGWEYCDRFLQFNLPMQDNPSVYYQKLIEGIVILTEWIDSLPVIASPISICENDVNEEN